MRYLIILLFALLTACGATVPSVKPFKMDIQQGNVVTSKMLLQLRPGMTKSQVKFIMGSPLLIDSFHTNRWDYFYQLRQAGKIVEQRRVILDFDKDLLTKVRGDVVPEGSVASGSGGAATGNESGVAKTITVAPKPKEDTSWTDKLKFWKKDEPAKGAVKPETDKTEKTTPESIVREAVKSESLDALEANTSAASGDAPSIDSATPETPSVLAVPIGGVLAPDVPAVELPAADAPVITAPVVEEQVVVAPVVEEPKAEMPKAEAPKSAPVPVPMQAPKAGERLIFRMDRNLDLKNLDLNNSVAPVEAVPAPTIENIKLDNNAAPTSAKSKKIEPPLPTEESPGYFERMLEKIGF